ncbi:trypsin-like serine peptidase [Hoeflea alexandrii]|uniref:trypsin-like serine peptidase n=1 Tax=Hoeflea alexandrii TaxID=288436 RepID=UPI0022AFB76F|nr:trypsin-like serine protease [Hoeflea alexandrii]
MNRMSRIILPALLWFGLIPISASLPWPVTDQKTQMDNSPNPYLHLANVLGKDDRRNIPNEWGYFTDMGGLLTLKFGESERRCTGYLIGREWILTAAHCVYDPEKGEAAQEVTFDLALTDTGNFLHPREYASEFWVLKDMVELVQSGLSIDSLGPTKEYQEKDLAVVHIPKLDGRRRILGNPLPMKTVRDPHKTVYMQTAGYPTDKKQGSYWFTECTGEMSSRYNVLNTQCDALPGQSGSAVVQIWSPDDLKGIDYPVPYKPELIGVISSVSSSDTYVALLTQELIDEIKGLIGKSNHSFNSFEKFRLKRNVENRLFVNNRCTREITVFFQVPVQENGKIRRIITRFDVPAEENFFLLSSEFASSHVLLQPKEINHVKLYRQTDDWDRPVQIEHLKKIYVEEFQKNYDGYDYELGNIWTDSKLILECDK